MRTESEQAVPCLFEGIPYTLIRQRRRSLLICVRRDNSVLVKASFSLSKRQIERFLARKKPWIQKTLDFNRHIRKPYVPKSFKDGELFWYMGDEFPLKIDTSRQPGLTLSEGVFHAGLRPGVRNQLEYFRRLFTDWYKRAACGILSERVNHYEKRIGVRTAGLSVRTLPRSWGNCSKSGVVTFSWRLAMAPPDIIDYIVVHELCHLIHHDHSVRFRQRINRILPGYQRYKQWLAVNDEVIRL